VWLIPIADERVDVQVKLWNPLRTRTIPERFCGGDSLRRGSISSVCTFTFICFTYFLISRVGHEVRLSSRVGFVCLLARCLKDYGQIWWNCSMWSASGAKNKLYRCYTHSGSAMREDARCFRSDCSWLYGHLIHPKTEVT